MRRRCRTFQRRSKSGFPDSDYTFWIGTFAPAGTAPEIVQRLHREMQSRDQGANGRRASGDAWRGGDAADAGEFGALVAKEVTTYADFTRKAGMKID